MSRLSEFLNKEIFTFDTKIDWREWRETGKEFMRDQAATVFLALAVGAIGAVVIFWVIFSGVE